ncbi:MAG: AAA family ATPase [Angustibacter sp.]
MNQTATDQAAPPTLTITVGIPGSGKSTWAREQATSNPDVVVTSRDDIRTDLYGPRYHDTPPVPAMEVQVNAVQHARVVQALQAGRDVIVDNTNLDLGILQDWADLADSCGADLVRRDFDVLLEIALARNAARERVVPPDVIAAMHTAATAPGGALARSGR